MVAFIVDFTWHHGRYTLPLIPFQMIGAAAGAGWLLQRLGARRRLGALVLVLLLSVSGVLRLPAWAGMLGDNTNEVNRMDVALGRWLSENSSPDALIAVDDIGAAIFMSERRVFDLNGLVSPEMWPALSNKGLIGDQLTLRLLSTAGVDLLAVFPRWHPALVSDPSWALLLQRFTVETHTIIGEQELGVYQVEWPYMETASPQVARPVLLGDAIQLLGYDLSPWSEGDGTLVLTLYWKSTAAVEQGYKVFVHLLDDGGRVVVQVDREPVDSLAPTDLWRPGDIVRDRYEMARPADLPAGAYKVAVGMYLEETMVRLPAEGEDVLDDAIALTSLTWPP
jgi:hypothetical protein